MRLGRLRRWRIGRPPAPAGGRSGRGRARGRCPRAGSALGSASGSASGSAAGSLQERVRGSSDARSGTDSSVRASLPCCSPHDVLDYTEIEDIQLGQRGMTNLATTFAALIPISRRAGRPGTGPAEGCRGNLVGFPLRSASQLEVGGEPHDERRLHAAVASPGRSDRVGRARCTATWAQGEAHLKKSSKLEACRA